MAKMQAAKTPFFRLSDESKAGTVIEAVEKEFGYHMRHEGTMLFIQPLPMPSLYDVVSGFIKGILFMMK